MANKGTGRDSKAESDIMKEFIVNSVDLKVGSELGSVHIFGRILKS